MSSFVLQHYEVLESFLVVSHRLFNYLNVQRVGLLISMICTFHFELFLRKLELGIILLEHLNQTLVLFLLVLELLITQSKRVLKKFDL